MLTYFKLHLKIHQFYLKYKQIIFIYVLSFIYSNYYYNLLILY